MKYNETNKKALLQMIGKNINYYRYHCNNPKLVNEKGIVTVEKLAEAIESSANMIYNLTAENVNQGVSLIFIDKIARALDIELSCFFQHEFNPNPPKYMNK